MSQPRNTLRIIGGEWRSRKLAFPDNPQLRPTPDRVRETLFNWLQNDIYQARCLDLFAGSGALGFEALSRGAAHCVFVESHGPSLQKIKENIQLLKTDKASVSGMDALGYLKETTEKFDLVFLDPPFDSNLWLPVLDMMNQRQLLNARARVYVESPAKQTHLALSDPWQILRDKTAGDVRYQLISC